MSQETLYFYQITLGYCQFCQGRCVVSSAESNGDGRRGLFKFDVDHFVDTFLQVNNLSFDVFYIEIQCSYFSLLPL